MHNPPHHQPPPAAGEITNPAFHIFNIVDTLRHADFPWAQSCAKYVALVFTVSFVFIRTVLGPPAVVWFMWMTLGVDAPWTHKVVWEVTAIGITAVSQLFAWDFVKHTVALWREHHPHHVRAAVPEGVAAAKQQAAVGLAPVAEAAADEEEQEAGEYLEDRDEEQEKWLPQRANGTAHGVVEDKAMVSTAAEFSDLSRKDR